MHLRVCYSPPALRSRTPYLPWYCTTVYALGYTGCGSCLDTRRNIRSPWLLFQTLGFFSFFPDSDSDQSTRKPGERANSVTPQRVLPFPSPLPSPPWPQKGHRKPESAISLSYITFCSPPPETLGLHRRDWHPTSGSHGVSLCSRSSQCRRRES